MGHIAAPRNWPTRATSRCRSPTSWPPSRARRPGDRQRDQPWPRSREGGGQHGADQGGHQQGRHHPADPGGRHGDRQGLLRPARWATSGSTTCSRSSKRRFCSACFSRNRICVGYAFFLPLTVGPACRRRHGSMVPAAASPATANVPALPRGPGRGGQPGAAGGRRAQGNRGQGRRQRSTRPTLAADATTPRPRRSWTWPRPSRAAKEKASDDINVRYANAAAKVAKAEYETNHKATAKCPAPSPRLHAQRLH